MAERDGQERTERATPKRLTEARERGHVAKSQDLPMAAVLLAGLIALAFSAQASYGHLLGYFRATLGQLHAFRLDLGQGHSLLFASLVVLGQVILPVMLAVFIVAILVNYAQVGALFTLKPLTPKFDKVNPFQGVKRYFSMRIVIDSLKNILKLLAVGWVAYKTVVGELPHLSALAAMPVIEIGAYALTVCFKIFLRCALLILALALADYAWQRWQYEKSLRMSKQEIKDEYKQREGDPMVKARIRSIQRKLAGKRMLEAVPKADVIVTNPTHLAVALQYVSGEMPAPQVVAKGADHLAEKIKEIAREHQVPVVENKPLAQSLYKLEVGQIVPEDLFKAVAQVLAYVYQLKGRRVAARAG